MPNTAQVHVQCARARPRTHVQNVHHSGCPYPHTYTYSVHVQAHGLTYNKCIAQAAHAEHCTCTRTGWTPMHAHSRAIAVPLRLHALGAPLRRHTPSIVQAHAHAILCDKYTARAAHTERRICTHTHTHVKRCTAWAAHAKRRTVRTTT